MSSDKSNVPPEIMAILKAINDEKKIAQDVCPDCDGPLDTGWECNKCGADFRAAAMAIPDDRYKKLSEMN
jgi:ribosomal protein L37AE/L43A